MLYKTLSAAVYGHAPARTPRYNSMQDVALGKRGAKRERRNYLGRQLRSNPPIITTTPKAWASYAAEMLLRMKSAESLVAANMQTTPGREYEGQIAKEFAEKFADVMQQCVQSQAMTLPGSISLWRSILPDAYSKYCLHALEPSAIAYYPGFIQQHLLHQQNLNTG